MSDILLRLALIPFSFLLFLTEMYYQPNRVLNGSILPIARTSERWEKAAPLPSFRYESAAGSIGKTMYVVGGIFLPSVWFPSGFAEKYDSTTDSWHTIAPYPVAVHHPGSAVVDDKLYVVGGNGVRITPRSDVFMYDPATDVWKRKASLPVARGALGVASLDGKIYAVGGGINKTAVDVLHIYDPASDTWKEGRSMPTAREHASAVGAHGKIYVLGGYSGVRFNNLTTNEVYDPKTDTWEKRAPMPLPLSGFTATAVGDSIFVFGGQQGWAVSNQVHEYKIRQDQWVRRSDMKPGRYASVSAIIDGKIHVIGGNTYIMGNVPSFDHDVFTP